MTLLLLDYRRMVNHGLVQPLVVTLFGLVFIDVQRVRGKQLKYLRRLWMELHY